MRSVKQSVVRTVLTFVASFVLVGAMAGCGLFGNSGDGGEAKQEQSEEVKDEDTKEKDGSEAGSNAVSDDSQTASSSSEDERLDLLVLVNKDNALPDGWEDNLELEGETNVKGDYIEVDKIAYDAFKDLQEDLEENEGITIQLNSGYRSVEAQQELWDELAMSEGEEYAQAVAAEPGHSEHHTGLAIDFLLVVDGEPMVTQEQIDEHDYEFETVYEYLPKYGFVLRYPEGKEDITGYDFAHEKWHIRYVGEDAAKEMMKEPITTLEEYLGEA